MIEIYLFVHPMCSESLKAEKTVLNFAEKIGKNIQIKFLPLLNLQTFQTYIEENPDICPTLTQRNDLFNAAYSSTLDYKAMQLQGKKKGRAFLIEIQQAMLNSESSYNQQLVEDTIRNIKGNVTLFKEDRQSAGVKKAFQTDQTIAKEMGITQPGSLVFFNYNFDQDFGISVTEPISEELLRELLTITPDNISHLRVIPDAPITSVSSHSSPEFLDLLQN